VCPKSALGEARVSVGRRTSPPDYAIRRLAEESVKQHLPAAALADTDLHAEVIRLRVENARLHQQVKVLTAALRQPRL
jgi:DNA anti-recombination protein RmuC